MFGSHWPIHVNLLSKYYCPILLFLDSDLSPDIIHTVIVSKPFSVFTTLLYYIIINHKPKNRRPGKANFCSISYTCIIFMLACRGSSYILWECHWEGAYARVREIFKQMWSPEKEEQERVGELHIVCTVYVLSPVGGFLLVLGEYMYCNWNVPADSNQKALKKQSLSLCNYSKAVLILERVAYCVYYITVICSYM